MRDKAVLPTNITRAYATFQLFVEVQSLYSAILVHQRTLSHTPLHQLSLYLMFEARFDLKNLKYGSCLLDLRESTFINTDSAAPYPGE